MVHTARVISTKEAVLWIKALCAINPRNRAVLISRDKILGKKEKKRKKNTAIGRRSVKTKTKQKDKTQNDGRVKE